MNDTTLITYNISNYYIEVFCFGFFVWIVAFVSGYYFHDKKSNNRIQKIMKEQKEEFDTELEANNSARDEVLNDRRKKYIRESELVKELKCENEFLKTKILQLETKVATLQKSTPVVESKKSEEPKKSEESEELEEPKKSEESESEESESDESESDESEINGIRVTGGDSSELEISDSEEEEDSESESDSSIFQEISKKKELNIETVFKNVDTYNSKNVNNDSIYILQYKKSIVLAGLKTKEIKEDIKKLEVSSNRNFTDSHGQKFFGWRLKLPNINDVISLLEKKKIKYFFMKR